MLYVLHLRSQDHSGGRFLYSKLDCSWFDVEAEVLNFFKETGMVVLSGTILGRNRNKFLENVDLTSSILHI